MKTKTRRILLGIFIVVAIVIYVFVGRVKVIHYINKQTYETNKYPINTNVVKHSFYATNLYGAKLKIQKEDIERYSSLNKSADAQIYLQDRLPEEYEEISNYFKLAKTNFSWFDIELSDMIKYSERSNNNACMSLDCLPQKRNKPILFIMLFFTFI